MSKNTNDYKQQATETLNAFDVTVEAGLTQAEAARRIKQYGYNAIDENKSGKT